MIAEQYRNVVYRLRALKQLGEVSSLLHWDQEVLLPKRGAAGRGDQLAIMAKLRHEQATDPRFVEELRSLAEDRALTGDEAVVVREAWRDIRRAVKVPAPLVEEIARSEAHTHTQWILARKERRFSVVKDALKKLLSLKREYAAAISAYARAEPGYLYDALLDL